jgi:hypothetical protein
MDRPRRGARLNKAVGEADRPERFADFLSGGQAACVIVGTAGGLAELIETIGLPLDVTAAHLLKRSPILAGTVQANTSKTPMFGTGHGDFRWGHQRLSR